MRCFRFFFLNERHRNFKYISEAPVGEEGGRGGGAEVGGGGAGGARPQAEGAGGVAPEGAGRVRPGQEAPAQGVERPGGKKGIRNVLFCC